jgi:TrbC/VIRB2 pilin
LKSSLTTAEDAAVTTEESLLLEESVLTESEKGTLRAKFLAACLFSVFMPVLVMAQDPISKAASTGNSILTGPLAVFLGTIVMIGGVLAMSAGDGRAVKTMGGAIVGAGGVIAAPTLVQWASTLF